MSYKNEFNCMYMPIISISLNYGIPYKIGPLSLKKWLKWIELCINNDERWADHLINN